MQEDQMNNISLQHKEKCFKVGSRFLNSIKTPIPWWPSKSFAKPELVELGQILLSSFEGCCEKVGHSEVFQALSPLLRLAEECLVLKSSKN
jgi:hypothetical protein